MIRFKDAEIDFNRMYRLTYKRSKSKDFHKDLVHSAWEELAINNKEYNDLKHVHSTLALRITALMIDLYNLRNKSLSKESSVEAILYKKSCPMLDWESNYDANKLLENLEIKSTLKASIFILMLESSNFGDSEEHCKELDMSLNTFKQHRHQIRKFITDIY